MRTIATVLMWLGVLLGVAVGVGISFGPGLHGLSWLVGVGLAKLTIAGALGLIAGGAVLLRLSNRAAARERLLQPQGVERGSLDND